MQLDLIAIGRVSVDLYGQQIGTPLEDAASFARAVGGCPANVAIGAARLGLRSALISRVGDEPMGGFVRAQLAREGVDTRGVRVDPQRLTALVLLSVRDEHTFPLIFYRENCADSALCEDDIDESFIAASRAVLLTGTHFSLSAGARAQQLALRHARAHGVRVILDIDYRPNLWGVGGHGAGASRYARSERATAALAAVLPQCDLIVGTEEELHIAAGMEDTLGAIRQIRAVSAATIVCKRGALGCVVFAGAIPASFEAGMVVPGLEVETYNVLGAGDAFLAGFLSGYLRGEPDLVSAQRGNACVAVAVSRLLCSPEFPTALELEHLLSHGSIQRALRFDRTLSHLHWVGTRAAVPRSLLVVRLDDADAPPADPAPAVPDGARGPAGLTQLVVATLVGQTATGTGFGVLLAGAPGARALAAAHGSALWRACALEPRPPLEPGLAAELLQWPSGLTVVFRCHADPRDAAVLAAGAERALLEVAAACRTQGRELLLEIRAAAGAGLEPAPLLARVYALGVRPDWWLLDAQPDPAPWQDCAEVIGAHDEHCRGILMACAEVPTTGAAARLAAAGGPFVRGLVVGRSIVAPAAHALSRGQLSDEALAAELARRCAQLAASWSAAQPPRHDRSVR
jgi:5-dehydro-2-deoxygluconokinase